MEARAVTPSWRKSSYTANGGGNCVEVGGIPWRKASYSANGGEARVEAANVPGMILIRDTKERGTGPVLRVSAETWRAFTAALRG
jgi:hypothetical protein